MWLHLTPGLVESGLQGHSHASRVTSSFQEQMVRLRLPHSQFNPDCCCGNATGSVHSVTTAIKQPEKGLNQK